MAYQSNALWAAGVCSSQYGDNISTDTHDTVEQSAAVCRSLRRNGFGGDGKHFPLHVWTSPVEQPPKLPKDWGWVEPPGYYNPPEARAARGGEPC
jgi:hypothetical protein